MIFLDFFPAYFSPGGKCDLYTDHILSKASLLLDERIQFYQTIRSDKWQTGEWIKPNLKTFFKKKKKNSGIFFIFSMLTWTFCFTFLEAARQKMCQYRSNDGWLIKERGRATIAEGHHREKGARKDSAFLLVKDTRLEFIHHTHTKLKRGKICLREL